jgi:hypothetical protein
MAENRVNQGGNHGTDQQIAAKGHSFGNRAGNDGCCRAAKGHLKDKKGQNPGVGTVKQGEGGIKANHAAHRWAEHDHQAKSAKANHGNHKIAEVF